MSSAVRLTGVWILALAIAAWAQRTPAPLGSDAEPSHFSAGRARVDLDWIAAAPHPTGSPENARVRDRLLQRLTALGLSTEVQHQDGLPSAHHDAQDRLLDIDNVIARLPGTDPSAPAILLMAHYDSVPGSPGAADDGAGVATLLEIARIYRQGQHPPPRHDLVFLFEDAEEPGLLGAQSFFADQPLARHLGAAINLEARGGGGRAYLFEVGPDSDELVRAFAAVNPEPSSTSFATFVYNHMPNGTDFTLAKRAGLPGFNFAFISRPAQYHSPRSTPAALELGSLQHLGDQVLASVELFDSRTTLRAPGPPLAWGDLLGRRLVVYGGLSGWLLIAACGALLAVSLHRAQGRRLRITRGATVAALLLVLGSIALFVSRPIALWPVTREGITHYFEIYQRVELAHLLLSLGAITWVAGLVGGRDDSERDGTWRAVLLFGLIGAIALQAIAPQLAPPLVWPLLLACAASCVGGALRVIALTLGLSLTFSWAHGAFLGVGLSTPPAMMVFVLVALLLAFPLAVALGRTGRGLGPVFIGAGCLLMATARLF